MIYIEKEIIFNKKELFVFCVRPCPSLHSLSVYCCREVVTDCAALAFPPLPSSHVGLELLLWGWSCRGAGAAMGLEQSWGWLFSPCKDRVEQVPLKARSCQVPARGQPLLLSRQVNFISRFYKNIRGTARDFKLISVFLFQCYYFFPSFFFFFFPYPNSFHCHFYQHFLHFSRRASLAFWWPIARQSWAAYQWRVPCQPTKVQCYI